MSRRAPALMVRVCAASVLLSMLFAVVPPPAGAALATSLNVVVDEHSFHVMPGETFNLTGNVTENPHGTPVAGARVRVANAATQVVANETMTDVHGAFRLEVTGPFQPGGASTYGVWAFDDASNVSSGVVNITVVTPIIEGPGFEGPAAGLALAAVAAGGAARSRLKRR